MQPFKSILVDVDSTATAHPALDRAVRIARACGARLRVVDVLGGMPDVPIHRRADIERALACQRHGQLLRHVRNLTGVTAETVVLRGEAGEALIREVIRGEHDLLIRSLMRDVVARGPKMFGTVSQQLFRKCPCPVWAVGAGALPASPRFIGAVHGDADDTASRNMNAKVIDLALFLADLERGSLALLEAWRPFAERRIIDHATDDDVITYLEAAEHRCSHHLQALRDTCDGRLAGVALGLGKGEPQEVILEYAVAHGIDTVVVGTTARTGISGFLRGNIAELLLKKAPCSVVAVKPDGFVSPVGIDDPV